MNAQALLAKAGRAAASAKVLLDDGDYDGACNRAYYAMFDAARAALLSSNAPVSLESIRTHNGLISAFSLHLVKPGRVSIEAGRALNKAEDLRLIADYNGDPIEKGRCRLGYSASSSIYRHDKAYIHRRCNCRLNKSYRRLTIAKIAPRRG